MIAVLVVLLAGILLLFVGLTIESSHVSSPLCLSGIIATSTAVDSSKLPTTVHSKRDMRLAAQKFLRAELAAHRLLDI